MRLRCIVEKETKPHGFVQDIESLSVKNDNFRKVLYTAKNTQLVLMSLKPGESIGAEKHPVDQFFRVEEGTGEAEINGTHKIIKPGSGIIIPANSEHNIMNTGDSPLQLYTLYSPPHHQDGIIHQTRHDAENDDEEFDGNTTE